VSGTNGKPNLQERPGFDARHDTLFNRNVAEPRHARRQQPAVRDDVRNHAPDRQVDRPREQVRSRRLGRSPRSSATPTCRARSWASMPSSCPPRRHARGIRRAGRRTLRYATGPNAGKTITNPTTLNGNGLLRCCCCADTKLNSLNNVTNDLRATRVVNLGGGVLTTTVGLLQLAPDDRRRLAGRRVSATSRRRQVGAARRHHRRRASSRRRTAHLRIAAAPAPDTYRRKLRHGLHHQRPFGSVNCHIGKIAIGGSLRYDIGKAQAARSTVRSSAAAASASQPRT
jgi:hypothetical protein